MRQTGSGEPQPRGTSPRCAFSLPRSQEGTPRVGEPGHRQRGDGVGGATAAGRGELWDGTVPPLRPSTAPVPDPNPIPVPEAPPRIWISLAPVLLGAGGGRCSQCLSCSLGHEARCPQPGCVPPPPAPSCSSPPLLPLSSHQPRRGGTTSGFTLSCPSQPRSVFQSPSLGLSLTNHPINPILLILLDP